MLQSIKKELKSTKRGSITGALIIGIICFLVLFPVLLLMTSIWAQAKPYLDNQITNSTMNATLQQEALNHINGLGDSFYYNSSDAIIAFMYLALIAAFFISAIYENSSAATLPIALLFLIPLILITFPLADLSHYFYTNAGFANIAPYYKTTEYLSDNSPLITILCTVIYLVLLITKKQWNLNGGGGGASVVSG